MAVYEVFSQAELIRYKASICSKATFAFLICLLLTFIPPFFVAYRSGDFWDKTDVYIEQPNVHFKYQVLVVINTDTSGGYVTWSTYQNYNQLQMDHLRIPLLKTREDDLNGDGLYDLLDFELSMPLEDAAKVQGVTLLLIFDYILQQYSYFEMESLAYITYTSPVSGATFDVTGSLSLAQSWPLGNSGNDTRYNTSVISTTSIYAQSFQIADILQTYSMRNVTTILTNVYPVWNGNRGAGQPFIIRAKVTYPIQYNIIYYTRFWQMIKMGWVQYVAILVLFWFVFEKIKIFIFQNQLITTIVQRPFKDKSL